MIFALTSGLKTPRKDLRLAIPTKILTDSRKVLDILNRLGHCATYSTNEELETKLLFEAIKGKRLNPNVMSLNHANNISAAFDNFDRYVETVSGKDTLIGVAFDYFHRLVDMDKESFATTYNGYQNKKRGREFVEIRLDMEPYRKKPKMLFSGMMSQSDVI